MVLAMLATDSFAGGLSRYPGSFCVADGPVARSGLSYNWGVRAENISSSVIVVNCPIVRDDSSSQPNAVSIDVYDGSSSLSVSCKFQSWNGSGTERSETRNKASGRTFVGRGSMSFTDISSDRSRTYNFLCKLPPKSYISSYSVNER